MTTWKIIEHLTPDRVTVRYTADDGVRSVVMPDMFWDQVTPLEDWLGRVDPWPTPPPADKTLVAPLVGLTGVCHPMERTPPLTAEEKAEMERQKVSLAPKPSDPLTAL